MPGRNWGSSSSYQAVRMFDEGTHPPVYYSPADPSRSLLEPGLHAANFGIFLTGAVFSTFASIVAVVGLGTTRQAGGSGTRTLAPGSLPARLAPFLALAVFLEIIALIWLS